MLFRRKPCFYTGGWAVLTEKCTGFRQSGLEILVLLLLPGVEIQEALCRGEYSPIMRLCSQEWEEFQSLLSPVLLLNPNLVFSPSTKASPNCGLLMSCLFVGHRWSQFQIHPLLQDPSRDKPICPNPPALPQVSAQHYLTVFEWLILNTHKISYRSFLNRFLYWWFSTLPAH